MDKNMDHLKSSFDNVQELIRFVDQKVALAFVICGMELGVFGAVLKGFSCGRIQNVYFENGASFAGYLFILMLFIALIYCLRILMPHLAKDYSRRAYSLYYFEHIADGPKSKLDEKVKSLDASQRLQELQDQLFEVSNILKRKIGHCSRVFQLIMAMTSTLLLFSLLVLFAHGCGTRLVNCVCG